MALALEFKREKDKAKMSDSITAEDSIDESDVRNEFDLNFVARRHRSLPNPNNRRDLNLAQLQSDSEEMIYREGGSVVVPMLTEATDNKREGNGERVAAAPESRKACRPSTRLRATTSPDI